MDLAAFSRQNQNEARKHSLRALKFLGLLAALLYPFYDKTVELLMAELLATGWEYRALAPLLLALGCVLAAGFVLGTLGIIIEDLLLRFSSSKKRQLREIANLLDE
ncbi:MAG: hypothetical protein FH749_01355 [Firmicutes bacterium]|nr:hypothetical protein [Bacillota bacterium]